MSTTLSKRFHLKSAADIARAERYKAKHENAGADVIVLPRGIDYVDIMAKYSDDNKLQYA